jgi:hypothetical protein
MQQKPDPERPLLIAVENRHREEMFQGILANERRRRIGAFADQLRDNMFVCFLQCDDCQGSVAVSGYWDVIGEYADADSIGTVRGYHPLFCHPPLAMLRIPERCTNQKLRGEIAAASQVYWCDPRACMNHIRQAIELLLDDMKVKKSKTVKGSGPRSLHTRIESLADKSPDLSAKLMALKWLGNAGSHSHRGAGKHSDALDGFELLDYVLVEWYDKRSKTLDRMARDINERKGPKSRRPF